MSSVVMRFQRMMQSTLFLSALGGLLGTLSFAPFNWPLVGWFAPWPIFILARRHSKSLPRIIASGLLFAFFLCAFAFYWTIYLFVVYGGLPVWLSLIVFFIHTFLLNLKIPLFMMVIGLLYRFRFRHVRYGMLLLVPLAGTILDKFTPQIFSWYWGNAVAGNPLLVQLADVVGIHGLTFALFFVSYAGLRVTEMCLAGRGGVSVSGWRSAFVRLKRRSVRRVWLPVTAFLALWFTYGIVQKVRYESIQAGLPKVRVAALQPDSPLEQYGESRLTPAAIEAIMTQTIPRLAAEAVRLGGPLDLILLPESAVPYYTTQDAPVAKLNRLYSETFHQMIVSLSTGYSVPVLFNEIGLGVSRDPVSGRPRVDAYNSAPLFGADGRRKATYNKRVLIAFGEQIPLASFLDRTPLIRLVPESVRNSRFRPGDDFVFMPYGADGHFLPLICYEILDPEYVRDFMLAGEPDFIANITQDRWYGKTIETFQHYELGRIRAVETRRAIVRSTNSGTSGMVDLVGAYAQPLVGPRFTGQEEQAVQVFEVPVNRKDETLFVRYGNAWLWLPAVAWLLLLAWKRRRRGR